MNMAKELKDTDEIKNTTPYIGFVDLIGKGDVILTISNIEDVSGDKVDGVREAKLGTYALTFSEIPNRKMILQGRKKKWLMRQFGKRKSDIVGKKVTLYGDPDVMFGKDRVGGIKFRGME